MPGFRTSWLKYTSACNASYFLLRDFALESMIDVWGTETGAAFPGIQTYYDFWCDFWPFQSSCSYFSVFKAILICVPHRIERCNLQDTNTSVKQNQNVKYWCSLELNIVTVFKDQKGGKTWFDYFKITPPLLPHFSVLHCCPSGSFWWPMSIHRHGLDIWFTSKYPNPQNMPFPLQHIKPVSRSFDGFDILPSFCNLHHMPLDFDLICCCTTGSHWSERFLLILFHRIHVSASGQCWRWSGYHGDFGHCRPGERNKPLCLVIGRGFSI